MFIPDPGSCFLPIPDPKIETKERGEKNVVVIPFFVATNFTKFQIVLFFYAEEINLELFTQQIVTKLSKIRVWDPGSEIRKKPIPDPDPGSKRHRIPDPDP
jgi:hypothetical protein